MQANHSHTSVSIQHLLMQSLCALLIGLFVFFFLGSLTIGAYQVWYAGRIFPGVSVGRVDLGGMTVDQAADQLESNFHFTSNGKSILWYGNTNMEIELWQIGVRLDAQASAREAFNFGRKGSLGSWLAFQLGGGFSQHDLPPTIIFDQSVAYSYLKQISQLYNRPAVEAGLSLQGTQVIAQPGQVGTTLNISASLEQISTQVGQMNLQQLVLPVEEITPQILDASLFANAAQDILNQPITFYLSADQKDSHENWTISPQELAPMLTFNKKQVDGQIQLVPQLTDNLITAYLEDLAQQVEVKTENPRFVFNDETGNLELLSPSISGRQLDMEKTKENIQKGIASGQKSIELAITIQQPEVGNDVTGKELGITELIHSESSYFYGSSDARIQNIETAANQFYGLLIPPYSTFSMAEAMGEISLDNGYTEALIIYNGQTIEGVGGGVCQVSTTLFRAAFFSGFPITERHPHAYRVSYYEKTSGNQRDPDLAGLDATVYVPLVDLKFTNDTPYWLLMETYVSRSANRITWKFYSTSDGRTVEWYTSGPTNIKEPKKPLYKLNSELSPGEIDQVEWEAEGADVQVDRTVYNNGQALFNDTFITHYEPWRAVYEYGPGTDGIPTNKEE